MSEFKESIILEKRNNLQSFKQNLSNYLSEYFYLNGQNNPIDIFDWKNETHKELNDYVDKFFESEKFQPLKTNINIKLEWDEKKLNNSISNVSLKSENEIEDREVTLIYKQLQEKELLTLKTLPKLDCHGLSSENVLINELKFFYQDNMDELVYRDSQLNKISSEVDKYFDYALIPKTKMELRWFRNHIKIVYMIKDFWHIVSVKKHKEKNKPIFTYCTNLYDNYLVPNDKNKLHEMVGSVILDDNQDDANKISNLDNFLASDLNAILSSTLFEDEIVEEIAKSTLSTNLENPYTLHSFTAEDIVMHLIETDHVDYQNLSHVISENPTPLDLLNALDDFEDFDIDTLDQFETSPPPLNGIELGNALFYDTDNLESWFEKFEDRVSKLSRVSQEENLSLSLAQFFDEMTTSQHGNEYGNQVAPNDTTFNLKARGPASLLKLTKARDLRDDKWMIESKLPIVVLDVPQYRILNDFKTSPFPNNGSEAFANSSQQPTPLNSTTNLAPKKINVFSYQNIVSYLNVSLHQHLSIMKASTNLNASPPVGSNSIHNNNLSNLRKTHLVNPQSHHQHLVNKKDNNININNQNSSNKIQPIKLGSSTVWQLLETWALINCIRQFQGFSLNIMITTPAHSPNWDFAADYVNQIFSNHKSGKECKAHYEDTMMFGIKTPFKTAAPIGGNNKFSQPSVGRKDADIMPTMGNSPNSKRQKLRHPTNQPPPSGAQDVGNPYKVFSFDNYSSYRKLVCDKFEHLLHFKTRGRRDSHQLFPGICNQSNGDDAIIEYGLNAKRYASFKHFFIDSHISDTRPGSPPIYEPITADASWGTLMNRITCHDGTADGHLTGSSTRNHRVRLNTTTITPEFDLNMALFNNFGINYNVPLDPIVLVRARVEKLNREKREQQLNLQQAHNYLMQQQQQQQQQQNGTNENAMTPSTRPGNGGGIYNTNNSHVTSPTISSSPFSNVTQNISNSMNPYNPYNPNHQNFPAHPLFVSLNGQPLPSYLYTPPPSFSPANSASYSTSFDIPTFNNNSINHNPQQQQQLPTPNSLQYLYQTGQQNQNMLTPKAFLQIQQPGIPMNSVQQQLIMTGHSDQNIPLNTDNNMNNNSNNVLLNQQLSNITNLTQLLNTLNQAAGTGALNQSNLNIAGLFNSGNEYSNTTYNTNNNQHSHNINNNNLQQIGQTLNLLDNKTLLKLFGGHNPIAAAAAANLNPNLSHHNILLNNRTNALLITTPSNNPNQHPTNNNNNVNMSCKRRNSSSLISPGKSGSLLLQTTAKTTFISRNATQYVSPIKSNASTPFHHLVQHQNLNINSPHNLTHPTMQFVDSTNLKTYQSYFNHQNASNLHQHGMGSNINHTAMTGTSLKPILISNNNHHNNNHNQNVRDYTHSVFVTNFGARTDNAYLVEPVLRTPPPPSLLPIIKSSSASSFPTMSLSPSLSTNNNNPISLLQQIINPSFATFETSPSNSSLNETLVYQQTTPPVSKFMQAIPPPPENNFNLKKQ